MTHTVSSIRRTACRAVAIIAAGLAVCRADARELIAITEIMRNPAGLESAAPGGASHEYVEIANLGTVPLRIDSLFIGDRKDADSVLPYTDPHGRHPNCRTNARTIAPGGIAVVLDPDYDEAVALDASTAYPFADSTILLVVGDNHLGDAGGLSQTEGVYVYIGSRDSVQRILAVAADGGQPFPPPADSLFLRETAATDDGQSIVLRSVLFGPPRYEPCPTVRSPGQVELIRNEWIVETRLGDETDSTVTVQLAALTVGRSYGESTTLTVHQDGAPGAQLSVRAIGVDSGIVRFEADVPLDTVRYVARLTDGEIVIETPIDITPIWAPPGAIRINELFPRADGGCPEWVEVVNRAPIPVNLRGWRMGNAEDSIVLVEHDLLLSAGAYWVFTKDAAVFLARHRGVGNVSQPPRWHTLDNYEDSLCLWDSRGRLHDAVFYDHDRLGEWPDGSIERVGAGDGVDQWAVAARPTPALPNMSDSWRAVEHPAVIIAPTPFTPNGDGLNDLLCIRVQLPPGCSVSLAIYSMAGRAVRQVGLIERGEYLWDGRDEGGRPAPVGPVFVVATVTDADGAETMLRMRGILWR